jgi:hypothetical protein
MNEIVLCSVNVGDWTKDALSTWIIMILNYNVQIPCRIPPVIRSNPGSLFGTRFWAASAHSTPVFPRPPSFPCTPLFQSGRDGLPANAVSGNQSRYPCPERPPRDGYPRHLTDSSPRDHFPDTRRRHPSTRRPPRHPLRDTPRRERFHTEPATKSPSRGDAWGPPPAATRDRLDSRGGCQLPFSERAGSLGTHISGSFLHRCHRYFLRSWPLMDPIAFSAAVPSGLPEMQEGVDRR